MPFSGSGTGIQNADDVFFGSLANGDRLAYNSAISKWANVAAGAASSSFTAAVSTQTSGTLTLNASSAQLTKLKSSLAGNLTVTLSDTTANRLFEISLIDTVFNGFTVTINGDIFSYPTYVRYVYIGSSWERVF